MIAATTPGTASLCSECGCDLPTRACVCGLVRYCGVRCQQVDWARHKQDCPPVVLREVVGKGMGLVTTRRVGAGKVIITESPIITHLGWTDKFYEFLDKFQELTVQQKLMYLSLSDPGEKSKVVNKEMLEKAKDIGEEAFVIYKVWRILWANGVYIGMKDGLKEKGVYQIISRINHACKANVVFGLVEPGADKMTITSCREIGKNQEILLNYIGAESIFNTRDKRQAELEENWHFACTCDVCSLTGQEFEQNEEIRKKIMLCKEQIREQVEPTLEVTRKAFVLGMNKLGLMEKIKLEVLAAFPFALMDCYGQARIIQHFGGEVKVGPEYFRDRAAKMSSLLGPSARSVCSDVEETTDRILSRWREGSRKQS
eukprot:GFUD01023527.1.p1 GENE.GFUD01023527.1~~GFUD01023527.1.p1  ORF type:complete len:381 (+),score=113.11 GFUD01023527.1:32-1144(+)